MNKIPNKIPWNASMTPAFNQKARPANRPVKASRKYDHDGSLLIKPELRFLHPRSARFVKPWLPVCRRYR